MYDEYIVYLSVHNADTYDLAVGSSILMYGAASIEVYTGHAALRRATPIVASASVEPFVDDVEPDIARRMRSRETLKEPAVM